MWQMYSLNQHVVLNIRSSILFNDSYYLFYYFYRYRQCHHSIFYGYLLVLYQPTRWRHNPSVGHIQLKMLVKMFVFTLQMFKNIYIYFWQSYSIEKKKKRLKSWNNRTCIACIVSTFIGVRRKFVVAWKRQRLTKVVLSITKYTTRPPLRI